jgi:hypothetical protein
MAGLDFTRQSLRDPATQRRLSEAKGAALSSAQANLEADLTRMDMDTGLASQAVHQFSPGQNDQGEDVSSYNPFAAGNLADEIERRQGTATDRPGWRNANQYASAGAKYAKQNLDQHGSLDEGYTAARHIMSPERADYMQKVGRTVDLLRGLRAGDPDTSPQVAMDYYRNSWQNPLARDTWNSAVYQREADDTMAVPAGRLIEDPTSPVGWYARTSGHIPETFLRRGEDAATAGQNTLAYKRFLENTKDVGGLSEVMNLPDDATPEQYAQRSNAMATMKSALAPPDAAPLVSGLIGNAPQAVYDTVGTGIQALDPTVLAAILQVPIRAIGTRLLSAIPGALAPKTAAQATMRSVAAGMGRQALEEGVGEIPTSGLAAASAAVQPGENADDTLVNYWTQPVPPQARDTGAASDYAQYILSELETNPNDLWHARNANNPAPQQPTGINRPPARTWSREY